MCANGGKIKAFVSWLTVPSHLLRHSLFFSLSFYLSGHIRRHDLLKHGNDLVCSVSSLISSAADFDQRIDLPEQLLRIVFLRIPGNENLFIPRGFASFLGPADCRPRGRPAGYSPLRTRSAATGRPARRRSVATRHPSTL